MRVKYNDKEVLDAVRQSGMKQMKRICLTVEREAKILVPVITGTLKRSITNDVEMVDDIIVGQVGTNIKYAPYVELGTKFKAARPYLRPALYGIVGRQQDSRIWKKEM